ncbi:MAG: DUF4265 domain-containing protein [Vulcanimicrobiaceae bacterium]
MNGGDMVKIVFPLQEGPAETMWADDLGNGLYRIDNIPWFAYDVSLHDVVSVRYLDGDPRPYFDKVVSPSGTMTYRVTLAEGLSAEDHGKAAEILERLRFCAEAYSRYSDDYIAATASSDTTRLVVERTLEEGEDAGYWDWETSTAPPL